MTAIDWLFWWTGALIWGGFLGAVAMVIVAGVIAGISNARDEKKLRDGK